MTVLLKYDELREAAPTLNLEIIQRLGCEPESRRPLVCDGKLGPRTRGGIYLDPRQLELPSAHKLGLVCLDELRAGAREVAPGPGLAANNRGPWVNKYCRLSARASLTVDRGAWCAFFASWALHTWLLTYHGGSFQKVGGARRLVRDEMPKRVHLARIQPGDLVAWESLTRPAPYGHVGVVVWVGGGWVVTIEGNVDLEPGLDGVAARLFRDDLIRADGARPLYAARFPVPGQLAA